MFHIFTKQTAIWLFEKPYAFIKYFPLIIWSRKAHWLWRILGDKPKCHQLHQRFTTTNSILGTTLFGKQDFITVHCAVTSRGIKLCALLYIYRMAQSYELKEIVTCTSWLYTKEITSNVTFKIFVSIFLNGNSPKYGLWENVITSI